MSVCLPVSVISVNSTWMSYHLLIAEARGTILQPIVIIINICFSQEKAFVLTFVLIANVLSLHAVFSTFEIEAHKHYECSEAYNVL